jgi:hypothetical protein
MACESPCPSSRSSSSRTSDAGYELASKNFPTHLRQGGRAGWPGQSAACPGIRMRRIVWPGQSAACPGIRTRSQPGHASLCPGHPSSFSCRYEIAKSCVTCDLEREHRGLLGAGLPTPPWSGPKVSMRLTRQSTMEAPLASIKHHAGFLPAPSSGSTWGRSPG